MLVRASQPGRRLAVFVEAPETHGIRAGVVDEEYDFRHGAFKLYRPSNRKAFWWRIFPAMSKGSPSPQRCEKEHCGLRGGAKSNAGTMRQS
jgi:hypothetical protein